MSEHVAWETARMEEREVEQLDRRWHVRNEIIDGGSEWQMNEITERSKPWLISATWPWMSCKPWYRFQHCVKRYHDLLRLTHPSILRARILLCFRNFYVRQLAFCLCLLQRTRFLNIYT